mgnify:CR=1 FL=1
MKDEDDKVIVHRIKESSAAYEVLMDGEPIDITTHDDANKRLKRYLCRQTGYEYEVEVNSMESFEEYKGLFRSGPRGAKNSHNDF